jgi:spore coat polysaccharide biosynthesis predicted glycosyltransferase SpsG
MIKHDSSQIIDVSDNSDFLAYSDKVEAKFDILIIDNLGARIESTKNSMKYLKDDSIVIWDNTDRPNWNKIAFFMSNSL